LDFGDGSVLFLVALHVLRSAGLVDGVPTILSDDVQIDARPAAPPYEDDAVVFARLERTGDAVGVDQSGAWYLPPLDAGHSGSFLDRGGRWRYDGDALDFSTPRYDSGF